VSLREVEGPAGAPWERPMHGTLDRLVVESDVLADNPIGDPARRPLWVYRPPGVELDHPRPLPVIYLIQGYTGQLDMWLRRDAFEPTVIERFDALFAAGGTPDALLVFVDAWTRFGGSQFLNSSSTGRYLDYLCDEVVAFVDERYPTAPERERRGLTGKSSGGYGAMVVPMLRPDVFGALASHAGDALFEAAYQPAFPKVARTLRDDFGGSWERFFAALDAADHIDPRTFGPIEMYGYAAAYSPDPAAPGRALLPFDANGRLVDDVWAQWLEKDPVRMAPERADALRSMRAVYLDAGRRDEYHLDLGAQAFSAELDKLGVEHRLELFDGTHGGITWRYPLAVHALATALST
jgi:S-formylglutathione hydrolase FrmB